MFNRSCTGQTRTTRNSRRHAGTMAQKRRLASSNMVRLLCGGLLLVCALVGMVSLSNSVTGMRASIADLEDKSEFLEAKAARLQAQWNIVTSADVVVARASSELGLILPEDPGQVLVAYEPQSDNNTSRWLQLFDGFGGGDPAVAGESNLIVATGEGRQSSGLLSHE